MKKKMALALSLAMAATTLAPAAVSAADEQVTLTIMSSIQTEDEGKLESAIADAYMEQNPNVKLSSYLLQTMIWMHRLPQWQLLMIFRMHSI